MSRARLLGSLDIPGTAAAPARARNYLATILDPAMYALDAIADVTLLTSELVTNAVVHTASGDGGKVTLSVLEFPGGGILVQVADEGSATRPTPRVPGDDLDTHGRGLRLVDSVAANWGHQRDGVGTTTWFLVDPGPATG
ncbi:ATP-binding protein [Spongiactinospora sp. TRM90649]|uniref:ATP-binding protein n=1 Tax=Spongiactinospora sp. TRM90649 TaxID=3031114 RepID=UPI0023F9E076|nr:ATP-binding protein [Spongiactinospora sp. TRM90649]MDF5753959.1 ATP-binding protein [Spongiactinospora sp. TRM90649]